jgi:hypothetical protein
MLAARRLEPAPQAELTIIPVAATISWFMTAAPPVRISGDGAPSVRASLTTVIPSARREVLTTIGTVPIIALK